MINQTAILIFANSAEKEVEKKSFLSKEVFFELNFQILQKVKKTGIPYFHFSEKDQIGDTFGKRFTNAVASIFEKGFQNIITIGNDTPHLKTKHLHQAIERLENNELVLGPSNDGGFYLMGINKNQFNETAFLNLPWQTSRLQKYIRESAIHKKIAISYLEILNDLDTKKDLVKIVNSFKSITKRLSKKLQNLIDIEKKIQYFKLSLTSTTFFSKHFNKGSPLVFIK